MKVFGSIPGKTENNFDISLFLRKPYSRLNHIDSKIEEDINMTNQFKTKICLLLLILRKLSQNLMLILSLPVRL